MVLDGDASNPEGLVRLMFGTGVEGEPKPLIEFFGRKIPDRMDVLLGVLDYTLESVSIAKRMAEFCREANIENFWLILNKLGSEEVESMLMDKLAILQGQVIGSISYDQGLIKAELSGNALGECRALEDIERIMERLEQVVSF